LVLECPSQSQGVSEFYHIHMSHNLPKNLCCTHQSILYIEQKTAITVLRPTFQHRAVSENLSQRVTEEPLDRICRNYATIYMSTEHVKPANAREGSQEALSLALSLFFFFLTFIILLYWGGHCVIYKS
jgi:hypothetical protein